MGIRVWINTKYKVEGEKHFYLGKSVFLMLFKLYNTLLHQNMNRGGIISKKIEKILTYQYGNETQLLENQLLAKNE